MGCIHEVRNRSHYSTPYLNHPEISNTSLKHLPFSSLYRALYLVERAKLLGEKGNGLARFDGELAQKRLAQWQAQPPFTDPALLATRLNQEKMDEALFIRLLGQNCGTYQGNRIPRWSIQLQRVFGEESFSQTKRNSPENNDNERPPGFLTVIAPLILEGRARLKRGLVKVQGSFPHAPIPDPEVVERVLFANIRSSLERMLAKTLVLELNIARLQGTLSGGTPEARYDNFIEQLGQPDQVRALIEEYPVLFRLTAAKINTWVHVSLEMVSRLCSDWAAIKTMLNAGSEPALLTQIESVGRNTRRGGRAVHILTFDTGFKVVYKPRSLAVEVHFQELLEWLNQHGHQPTFRLLKLLNQGTHGWVEWLAAAECSSTAALERFYQRQGAYLALFYALEATDFHLDNVIAVGENPMFIDLEALFHPRHAERNLPALEQKLDEDIYYSVLRTGLLPEPELGKSEASGFDLSGLAGTGDQQTPYQVPKWENKGTDVMQLVRQPTTISGGKNIPAVNGQPVCVIDFAPAIQEGFVALYQLLMQRHTELLNPNSPLARFAQDHIRILPRSGYRYSLLLEDSFHPDFMRDGLDYERFLDRLWLAVEHEPTLARLIPYEKADLRSGNIPLFTARADSQDAYSSSGQRIPCFFPKSGLESARQRISALTENDLARQCWFIQASLATVARQESNRPKRPSVAPTSPASSVPSRQQLLDWAVAIGSRLDQLAVRAEGETSWAGVVLVGNHHWEITPLDLDLYNGLPGVVLFLAQLGNATGQGRWIELAQSAVATMQRYISEGFAAGIDELTTIGAFDGVGGLLYSLAHLQAHWQQPELLRAADLLVSLMENPGRRDMGPGLANGVAGGLVGLLALHQVNPTTKIERVTQQWGDYLLEVSQPGSNWLSNQSGSFGHTFDLFWHGAFGTAWALLAAADLMQQDRNYQAALTLIGEAFASELDAPPAAVPGAALSCLRLLPYIEDATDRTRLKKYLKDALQMALAHQFSQNHSLGHGAFGCLDLLLQARAVLNDEPWVITSLEHKLAELAVTIRQDGWITGIPLGVESPGLMAGLAGIGYGLLRLANPQQTPSILAFSMPYL